MIEYVDCVDSSKKMSLKMIDERSDDVTAANAREPSSIPHPLWDAQKISSCIGYSFLMLNCTIH